MQTIVTVMSFGSLLIVLKNCAISFLSAGVVLLICSPPLLVCFCSWWYPFNTGRCRARVSYERRIVVDHKISNEQKAHDLSIAYIAHFVSDNDSAEDFFQDYQRCYDSFLKYIEHYNG